MKKALLFLGFLLVSVRVMAQDPLGVGPNIYKMVFENERIRVMEITFKPGDKIALHSHPDHFVYITSAGKLLLSYPDGHTAELEGKVGDNFWISAETHAAENTGTTEVKGLVFELKESKPVIAEAASEIEALDDALEPAIAEEMPAAEVK